MLLIALLSVWFYEYNRVKFFGGLPFDGAFQVLNGLHRFSTGMTFGMDYIFFHGYGMLLFHLPIYLLFGQNLFASEVSRSFVSFTFYLVSTLVLFRALKLRFKYNVLVTLCFVLISFKIEVLMELISSGNSFVGARTSFGIIYVYFVMLVFERLKKQNSGLIIVAAIAGMFAGISLLISVDQGVVVILTLLFFFVLSNSSEKAPKLIYSALIFIGAAAFSTVVSYLLVFYPNGFDLLHYYFVLIPKDQFWYFGVPPNDFIVGFRDIFEPPVPTATSAYLRIIYAFLLMIVVIRLYMKNQKTNGGSLFLVAGALLFYGMLSAIFPLMSYVSGVHYSNIYRLNLIISGVLLVRMLFHHFPDSTEKIRTYLNRQLPKLIIASTMVFCCVFVYMGFVKIKRINDYEDRVPISGVILADDWKLTFEDISKKMPDGKTEGVWSLYSALWEKSNNYTHPSKFDYIIHALGSENRQHYLNTFIKSKPKYVVVPRGKIFFSEEWNQKSSWYFYEEMIKSYFPSEANPHGYVWIRRDSSLDLGEFNTPPILKSTESKYVLQIPDSLVKDDVGIAEIRMEYSVIDNFPLWGVSKLTRYFIQTDSNNILVSLPPYENKFTFPVFIQKGQKTIEMKVDIRSFKWGERLKIDRIQLRIPKVEGEIIRALNEKIIKVKKVKTTRPFLLF